MCGAGGGGVRVSYLGQVHMYIVELVGAYAGCFGDVEGKVLWGAVG